MEKIKFELTNPQKSIWLTNQMYPNTPIENICGSIHIEENIDTSALEKAINSFVENNDSFRIKIVEEENKVQQYISDYQYFEVEKTYVKNEDELKREEKSMVEYVFPLLNTLLFKFKIFEFPNKSGGFIVNAHHLIADAWTAGLVLNEIMDLYAEITNKKEKEERISTSYIDYANTEKEYLESIRFQKDKEYWENIFQTVPEVAKVPSMSQKISNKLEYKSSRIQIDIPSEIINKINEFCSRNRVSIFNFFMAVYSIYIGKVSSLEEFVIGTPILNRTTFKEKHTIGMFISTVPFKICLKENETFENFVSDIAKDSLGMLRHQKYPYQYLLETLRKKQSSIPNLYDILISYQNARSEALKADVPFHADWISSNCLSDGMNIHIYDINDTGILSVAYDYLVSRYTEQEIKNMHYRVLNIINQVLRKNNIEMRKIEVVTKEEKKELLEDFNNTSFEYDKTETVAKLFEEQVKKTPDNIALVFENRVMTYRELNERANSVAYLLRKKGVKPNEIVGVFTNRSFETIISILAVLKAGGAYIPIDPEYPSERVEYMLENSKSKIILSTKSLQESIKFEQQTIFVDLTEGLYNENKENLKNINNPSDLSYLIYTSGSTGTPKGVMLTQKNLTNFCESMYRKIEYLKDGKQHSIISITTVSFDIFCFETIVSLTKGLKLCMTNYFEQKITAKLERVIRDNKIEILQTTPSTMKFHLDNLSMNSSLKSLKYVMLAGEQLPKSLVDRIKELVPGCIVYNGYGPSETTIFSTVKDVTNSEEIEIGQPIGNTQIYILGKDKSIMPTYTPGEIYIAGDGVGLGYKGNEEITKKGFIRNPFSNTSLMYKTGDLGYWLPDGNIRCLGRVDNQIKLRGLRIELGEIEEIINSFDKNKKLKSGVIVKDKNEKASLHAFFASPNDIDVAELKKHIQSYLPNYMIPNTFTKIEELPTTPNGKIDRKALQNVTINYEKIENEEITPPRNELDKILLKVIKENLNIKEFGIDQNIFEHGADSLIIINVLTGLFQYDFGLKVGDFYQFPTIRHLSNHIETKQNSGKEINEEKLNKLNDIVKTLNVSPKAKIKTEQKNILITGATGFLGAHLLAKILDNPKLISKLYCVVRTKNDLEPKKRLYDIMNFYFGADYEKLLDKYVQIVEADITTENWGLDEESYDKLAGNVDTVLHCAANVKHYGNYADFEKVNIRGTKNTIKFCNKANAELHYISTMTISANYLIKQEKNKNTFTESVFYENQNFEKNVYAKSKLLAEGYVIAAIDDGLNATIYRIGDLSGRYTDGVFQKNIEENSIYLRLKSILEIGYVSESLKKLELEFTPIDEATDAIIKIMWSTNALNRIFHIYNPNKITTDKLLVLLKDYKKIEYMESEMFMKYVKELSVDEENKKSIKGIINDFTNDSELIYNYTIPVDNSITCKYLKNLNFKWSKLTKEYFNKLINYMKNVNFIN